MPGILLFPNRAEAPEMVEVLRFIRNDVGLTAESALIDADDLEGTPAANEVTITGDDGRGAARVLAVPHAERPEETQALLDEIIEQDPAFGQVFENKLDLLVEFDGEDGDVLAGCVTGYALATICECGMLVVGLADGDESEEEQEHEHDESCGDDCGGMHTVTRWYDSAEDFAEDFFMDADDQLSELEDDEENGNGKP